MHKYTFRKAVSFNEIVERFAFYTWYGRLITAILAVILLWFYVIFCFIFFGGAQ